MRTFAALFLLLCLLAVKPPDAQAASDGNAEAEILSRVGRTFWAGKAPRYAAPVTFRVGVCGSTGFSVLEKASFEILEFIKLDVHRPEMGLYKVRFESGEEAYLDCSQFAAHLARTDSLPTVGDRRQLIFAEDPDLLREKKAMEVQKRLKEIEQKQMMTPPGERGTRGKLPGKE